MTEADAARARGDLGVKTVIDLRQPGVAARTDDGPLATPPTRYHNIPLIDDGDMPEDSGDASRAMAVPLDYLRRLEQPQYGEGIVESLRRIAEPGALAGGGALLRRQGPHAAWWSRCCWESSAWMTRIS